MNHPTPAPLGFVARFARLVADHVRAQGLDHRPVLAVLGLPEDEQAPGPQWVSAARIAEALHLAGRLCHDPQIGLTIGQQVRPATMGSLGYAMISCTAVEDGLALFERLQGMVCTQLHMRTRLTGEAIECTLRATPDVPADTALWTFTMVSRLAFARWVLGHPLVPLAVAMPCPAPPDPAPLLAYVGVPISFDAPHAMERVPAAWLRLPNPNADPELHRVMQALTQQQWARQGQAPDQVLATLRRHISAALRQGELPLLDKLSAELEDALGLSARQLQRRLAEQGLSFKDLVEQLRRDQVLHELRDTPLPMADIARRAAYAELSSMHRAVRRWTGLTPLAVRQQHAAAKPA